MNTLHPMQHDTLQSKFLFGPESGGPAINIAVRDSTMLVKSMNERPGFTSFCTDGTVSSYSRAPEAGEDNIAWEDSQHIEGADPRPDGMYASHHVDIQPPLSRENIAPAAEVLGRHLLAAQLGESGLNPALIANELRVAGVPFAHIACNATVSH